MITAAETRSTLASNLAAYAFSLAVKDQREFIDSCPSDLQKVLRDAKRELAGVVKGEYRPSLLFPVTLNEFFGVTNLEKVSGICAGYVACDQFTHLLDDLADERDRSDTPFLAHASHIMLSQGRRAYLEVVSSAIKFLPIFEGYVRSAMFGEQWLWGRLDNCQPYSPKDFAMLKARGSLLNACLAAYCDVTGRSHLLNDLEKAFGNIVVGIQLLDDVVDVAADFHNRIYTQPLAAVISNLDERFDWEKIAAALVSGSAWKETIRLSQYYLRTGRRQLDTLSLNSCASAVQQIETSANDLLDRIEDARRHKNISATETIDSILTAEIVRNLNH